VSDLLALYKEAMQDLRTLMGEQEPYAATVYEYVHNKEFRKSVKKQLRDIEAEGESMTTGKDSYMLCPVCGVRILISTIRSHVGLSRCTGLYVLNGFYYDKENGREVHQVAMKLDTLLLRSRKQ
jgi:DNA-directed RNA polymerase subunit RPC12/RpoP